MLIKGIDFPERLLRAQMTGDLVIFAGAGASCPAPSSLPTFRNLAKQVGSNSGVEQSKNEPEDRYLGRLGQSGVRVHELVARILTDPQSRPNDLHRLLLKIATTNTDLRLVTTNFDNHFLTAANELFESRLETFFAPALPLGNDFTGLVYLHGCATRNPKSQVLTDEDFGRAYLTEAWATRFLAAMFNRYTVLFVGYSHNDPVMNYLSMGLPPTNRQPCFAFTTASEVKKWEFLGTTPLVYSRAESGDDHHGAVKESLAAWVRDIQGGFLGKAQRIRTIVETRPPYEVRTPNTYDLS